MKDVQRKHTERNLVSFETDETNNTSDMTRQSRVAYKSLNRANTILKRDRDHILLPRRHVQTIDTILSSFYKPDNPASSIGIVDTYPILEDNFKYNLPLFPNIVSTSDQGTSETYRQNTDQQALAGTSTNTNYLNYHDRKITFSGCHFLERSMSEKFYQAGFFYTGRHIASLMFFFVLSNALYK